MEGLAEQAFRRHHAQIYRYLRRRTGDPDRAEDLAQEVFADAAAALSRGDWAPDSITWSVDGNVYQRRTPADLGGKQWVFNKPYFLILNLAVGGYWPGDPDGSTVFPQQLVVDHVSVTTGDAPAGGAIRGLAGKCVDVAGADTANGTPVQLYDCNGTAAQNWTVGSDGTVRALGKCLDVASGGTADGTPVQLWDCNGTAAQKWVVTAARDIVNPQAAFSRRQGRYDYDRLPEYQQPAWLMSSMWMVTETEEPMAAQRRGRSRPGARQERDTERLVARESTGSYSAGSGERAGHEERPTARPGDVPARGRGEE